MSQQDDSKDKEFNKEKESNVKTVDVDKLAKEFDAESRYRPLVGKIGIAVTWIAIAMSVFHLSAAGVITMMAAKQRALHLMFTLVLIFLMYPARKKSDQVKPTVYDYILAAAGAAGAGYIVFMYDDIAARGLTTTTIDLVMGAITSLVVLEAARRSIGKELTILAVLFLAYAYLGPYLPDFIAHRGYSIETIIQHMYIGSEGIFGIALSVSATYIFLFILFGAFLNGTGMSQFFTNASLALAGHKPGGPAKVSILASGSLGMINGSAVANVATTGVFTIPLMSKIGYKRKFAAGVESVASTGGQFMPPIMGTATFIMAEFIGVPYVKVMLAALIPAVLYYVSLWVMVHYEAVKTGLKGLKKEELPDFKKIFKQRGHLLLPIALLLYMLLENYTPVYAAFFSIIATYILSFLRKETKMDLKTLMKSLEDGAKSAVPVAIATAVVGFIIGVVTLTGVGLRFANLILVWSNGELILTLLFTMLALIILGMGLPTSAAYIVGATVAAPALIQFGVAPVVAHMFVLYFACLSAITPPVALASYTGAGISGSNPSEVGWIGFRLGITGFVVPFMFVFSPVLLLQSGHYLNVGLAVITAIIGVFALGTAVIGYMFDRTTVLERVMLFISALCMIKSGLTTDFIGIGLLLAVILFQGKRVGKGLLKKRSTQDEVFSNEA